jgi:hypothetical protein
LSFIEVFAGETFGGCESQYCVFSRKVSAAGAGGTGAAGLQMRSITERTSALVVG